MPSGLSRIARRIRVPFGFVFAAFYLWLARPTPGSIAWSLLLVVPGLLLRACASGYVRKNDVLSTGGPYAYTRNPLYLGSMMIAFGFALASESIWIAILLAIFFAAIYGPTILGEEEYLRSKFSEFEAYARRVPRLLPRLRRPLIDGDGSTRFSAGLYRKHREYNAALGSCAIYAVLLTDLLLRR